ncbi:hypothetical protein H6G80_26770 [Nostoc sp. FACHB-87]|uniref:hypothetical protein n=1 Tax=Nostocaceae TaxID=1162 RepID=UPI0016898536|nr:MULTISPECIES: hypothetical protein [Nostocaceae]MBD2457661.1 hypothetical protein [Nostoc sp. FACHB-87]MBD2478928.1 hypothetical protein [Anabaena sp. FACHB-83]
MQILSNKSRQLLTHTITDHSQGNTTTYTWNCMWSHHICPCCSYGLLRHISNSGIYWHCSHCYQQMPNWDLGHIQVHNLVQQGKSQKLNVQEETTSNA